jgi:hypothetical protein
VGSSVSVAEEEGQMSIVHKLAGALALTALAVACEQGRVEEVTATETDGITGASQTSGDDTTSSSGGSESTDAVKLDLGGSSGGEIACADGSCNEIDLLFVMDNSGTMGEEQRNLAANLPRLVNQLQNLRDSDGNEVNPSVNIMVTTTDMGHPLCTPFQKPDYVPRQGAPVYTGCNSRINRFTGLEMDNPLMVPEACTDNCPVDIAPGGPFIHFDIDKTNVPEDDVAAALSCIGPQGIDGCGYEAQLESMLQALYPEACWNKPDQERCENDPEWQGVNQGFLRPNAVLAVVMVTDEVECSVIPPDGFSYFTDDDQFWETNPDIDLAQATSAVCWNAGVDCEDTDGDGDYESCASRMNSNVLHPTERYTTYLRWLREELDKEVVMLGILGVPPVTAHNEEPPFQPTEGGVLALEYRDWIDGEYPAGDILPEEWAAGVTADTKRFEFGPIGPGCTGQDMAGGFTGQAIAPTRIIEVCESLNYEDENGDQQIRCCIESICDEDFSQAIDCLTGILQTVSGPAG